MSDLRVNAETVIATAALVEDASRIAYLLMRPHVTGVIGGIGIQIAILPAPIFETPPSAAQAINAGTWNTSLATGKKAS
jgi:hypothetical protein